MGVRHVCVICVILWSALSQIYAAPAPQRERLLGTSDVAGPELTHKNVAALPSRRLLSTSDVTKTNSAMVFPTDSVLGDRSIFSFGTICSEGFASDRRGGCRRVFGASRSRVLNPIIFA